MTPTPSPSPAPRYTLSGTVFFDCNGNGLRGEGEKALESVIVQSGESITKSLADGSYMLEDIPQGEIQLEIAKDGFPFVALSPAQVLTANEIPLNIEGDTKLDIGLMQGWMTLPFETEGDALMCNYVDLDYQLGSVRTYSDEHSHPSPNVPNDDNHQGIDWVAEEGTPIHAVGPGVVIEVDGMDPMNGSLHLHILHHFGGRAFVTSYGHYSASMVNVGDEVRRGQVIAFVGKTGTEVAHLHLGLWEVPPEFKPGQVREILDYIYRTNKLTVPYANGKEVPAVLDPFRDVIDPQSESFWTVDNSPHYVSGAVSSSIRQPTPKPLPIPEQIELKYDDGISDGSCSSGYQGFMVHFSPLATPFMIGKVKVFTGLHGSGYEDQVAWFEIRDNNLNILYYWNKSATTFGDKPSWVTLDTPDIAVNDDFYVVFYPCSTKEGGVYLHYDSSQMNNTSETAEPGGRIADWVWGPVKEKTNWMIRVLGAPTDEVVSAPSLPFQTINGSAAFQEIVVSLDNPEKLSQWLVDNIKPESHYERWKETGINYIASPDETFETGLGCCAEFAVFACYVLQNHNYQAEVLTISVESEPRRGHTVCVYQSAGSLWTIDVGRIKGPYQTYEDIAFDYYKGWSEYDIYHSWDKYQKLGPPDKVVHRNQ